MKFVNSEVTFKEKMGSDLSVVNAARVSFNKESQDIGIKKLIVDGVVVRIPYILEKDEKLIKYLSSNGHWTPFGQCDLKFNVKMPIFVARQLVRHTVGFTINEVSRRYVDYEPEFYNFDHGWRERSDRLKQGSLQDSFVTHLGGSYGRGAFTKHHYEMACKNSLDVYNSMLTNGVCPEQARCVLPLSSMTEWVWKGSLYAFARMCNLRLDSHAQLETREVARLISAKCEILFPVSWKYLVSNQ